MTARVARARRLISAVLGFDAFIFWLFVASPDHPTLSGWIWGLAFAAPFVAAWVVLLRGDELNRALFARLLAWVTAIGVGVGFGMISLLSWSAPAVDYTELNLMVAGFVWLQLVVPAAVRWVRRGGTFLHHYYSLSVAVVFFLVPLLIRALTR